MTRIDRLVLRRVWGRILMTVTGFFVLACLVESLDTWRFGQLNAIGGPLLGLSAMVLAAGRVGISTLPVTVLLGTMVGVLDLQSRREFVAIKAAGVSIWRVMAASLVAAIAFGLVIATVGDATVTQYGRVLPISYDIRPTTDNLWLDQQGDDGRYVIHAARANRTGTVLAGVTVFAFGQTETPRIEAAEAVLEPGAWRLKDAVAYRLDAPAGPRADLRLATTTTAGDLQIRLASARDLTLAELWTLLGEVVADPVARRTALTNFLRLLATPVLLAGSLLMGFAFTSAYRRTNNYGAMVLYGIVLGFVVFVVTDLANRSGVAGVLDPVTAALGPAFLAIVVGLTVLLYREDGKT